MADSRFHPAPRRRDPLLVVGATVAALILLLAFGIGREWWIEWFSHPMRVERLGEIPSDTIQGVRVLRIAAVLAALAWVLLPAILRRFDGEPTRNAAAAPSSPPRIVTIAVLLITIIAMVLRVPRLLESLWYDEIAAFIATSIHGPGVAFGNYHALANHALHSALVACSMQAFGGSDAELAIRLPAFLAGVASVPAMFVLGRAIDGDRLGLLAAGVLAAMPVAILESVEARGYSMMILFTILAAHQWLRITEGRRDAIAWYALMVSLGTWSHLVYACVPLGHAVQAAIHALRHPEDRVVFARRTASLVLGGVSTLLVIAPLLPGILMQRTEFIALDGDEPRVFGIEGIHAIWQLGGSWTWWAAVPGLGLAVLGLAESRRWPRLGLVTRGGIAGGLVCVTATLAGGSWLYARFTLFLLPPAALLIAAGLCELGQFSRRRGPPVVVGTLLLTSWMIGLALLPPKQPIREAVATARQLAGEDGRAWSIGLGDDVAMFYSEGRGPDLIHAPFLGRDLGAPALEVGPDVAVMLYPGLVQPDLIARLRAAGFTEHARYPGWLDWNRGEVLVWRRSR